METIDELKQVFAKYNHVVVQGQPVVPQSSPSTIPIVNVPNTSGAGSSLLDLMTPSGENSTVTVTEQLADLGILIVVHLF